jgi:hypothetical protein
MRAKETVPSAAMPPSTLGARAGFTAPLTEDPGSPTGSFAVRRRDLRQHHRDILDTAQQAGFERCIHAGGGLSESTPP